MRFDDDDDVESFRRPNDVFRSDKGKPEQRERHAKAKGQLRKLQLAHLRASVGKDAENTEEASASAMTAASPEEPAPETFGTKTHLQEEKAETQTAQERQDDEKLIGQERRVEQAKSQSGEEYQREPG